MKAPDGAPFARVWAVYFRRRMWMSWLKKVNSLASASNVAVQARRTLGQDHAQRLRQIAGDGQRGDGKAAISVDDRGDTLIDHTIAGSLNTGSTWCTWGSIKPGAVLTRRDRVQGHPQSGSPVIAARDQWKPVLQDAPRCCCPGRVVSRRPTASRSGIAPRFGLSPRGVGESWSGTG